MEDKTEYVFTPAEAVVIGAARLEAQAKIDALNAMVRLVVNQQGLAGNWQLKQDASGLTKLP